MRSTRGVVKVGVGGKINAGVGNGVRVGTTEGTGGVMLVTVVVAGMAVALATAVGRVEAGGLGWQATINDSIPRQTRVRDTVLRKVMIIFFLMILSLKKMELFYFF